MKITINKEEAKFLVRIADTSLILGQRMAEMCSKGPYLEEDIAMSNASLDLFGRAEEMYKIISKIEGNQFSEDDYVFHRNEREYYNIKLVEQPNVDFAWTMVRQYFYDVYAKEVYTQLLQFENSEVKGLAEKVLKEIKYSHSKSKNWLYRLGLGTEESNNRLQIAVDHLLKYVSELFNWDDLDKKYFINCDQIETQWNTEIDSVFEEINIKRKEVPPLSMRDCRDGFHSEHMGHLLSIMQYLPRAYPDAKW
ncbi:MAG: phenylacetate-CoA oxygenase subunit PaaC [Crocinitomicaceae bacterium]|nr:phenylacetate-CoA oxygenase subunit PaaC [Crocinitomicaceae bacterium]